VGTGGARLQESSIYVVYSDDRAQAWNAKQLFFPSHPCGVTMRGSISSSH
jgi:hypothetical protein